MRGPLHRGYRPRGPTASTAGPSVCPIRVIVRTPRALSAQSDPLSFQRFELHARRFAPPALTSPAPWLLRFACLPPPCSAPFSASHRLPNRATRAKCPATATALRPPLSSEAARSRIIQNGRSQGLPSNGCRRNQGEGCTVHQQPERGI